MISLIVFFLIIKVYLNVNSFISTHFTKSVLIRSKFMKTDLVIFSHSNILLDTDSEITILNALKYLDKYNEDYNIRMRLGKNEGKHPKQVDFERAQVLKAAGMKGERMHLKTSSMVVSTHASEIVLGILADTGIEGLETLRNWITGLQLPRGMLQAYDEAGREVSIEAFNNVPVYIKYNSTNSGNAYMKINPSNNFTGVIFQPKLNDSLNCFYQFGNLPLKLFYLRT